ncbi:MAG TPA: 23S rRNA (adenine(2503)-C(2))-methyltransferase RlmN [Candidatus Baltobacteraceae bacterium]|nr:23S rRNA (adenine(2503)-C(2))-methyltransferase RlmN [Candidatus Baltobacteraceae bacterium]
MELLGKSREELKAYCAGLGEPAYRADQIYHWLYAEREFSVEGWSNLPAALREKLKREAVVTLPLVQQRYVSTDGSVRYLFGLAAQEEKLLRKPAAVEAVFMPSGGRQTICISTQAGCAVDCQFCLTAQLGLIRNLTAGEMVAQVLMPLKEMEQKETDGQSGAADKRPASEGGPYISEDSSSGLAARTNVVLMGQGEPLLNFENVMGTLRILLDAEGVGLSPKHVTLSTSGIVPGIERLGKEEVRPKLAISLNASCDEQRDVLMPINKKYPLKALMEACRNYPLRNWEHLTFEYVMLGGVNDAAEDARRVVRLLAPLTRVKVNLIPWNPGELPYKESSAETIEEFRRILVEKGVPAFVRYSRGRDVMAACGQLALKEVQGTGGALTVLG